MKYLNMLNKYEPLLLSQSVLLIINKSTSGFFFFFDQYFLDISCFTLLLFVFLYPQILDTFFYKHKRSQILKSGVILSVYCVIDIYELPSNIFFIFPLFHPPISFG